MITKTRKTNRPEAKGQLTVLTVSAGDSVPTDDDRELVRSRYRERECGRTEQIAGNYIEEIVTPIYLEDGAFDIDIHE
jgi:hypothetical protein